MDLENEDTRRALWISKVIAGSGLFTFSVICGVIPFKLAKVFKWTEPIDGNNSDSKKYVNLLLCFGGGVLLATTFLHLLPDINYELNALIEHDKFPNTGILTGEFFMMIGFFMIYLIEEIVHNYIHRYQAKKELETSEKAKNDSNLEDALVRGADVRNSAVKRFSEPRNGSISMPSDEQKNCFTITDHSPRDQGHPNGHGHSHLVGVAKGDEDDVLVSSLRGLLIVLALSIHELFEGFAVGLERDPKGVYFMFAAVSAHKFVISFCIGVELMVQRTKLWLAFVYILIYSAVSAIGIAIGGILTSFENADGLEVPNIILQGIATGTLLYVVFFEVLSKDKSGLFSYASVLFGFALMAGLQFIAGVSEAQMGTQNKGEVVFNSLRHHH